MYIRWPWVLNPTDLSRIIWKQKNPLTALKLFNEAQSMYPNYRHNGPVYAAMIGILGKSGRIGEMKEVINQMRDDSCECKDSVFVAAMKTYAKSRSPDEAIALFNDIPRFNCVNWTESFNTILKIIVDEMRFDEARRVFLKNSFRWEVSSRLRSLNFFMLTLCDKGRSDVALQIFQEMEYQGVYPDRESYRVLMKGLCRDRRLNEATHLLYSMFRRISLKGCGEDVVIYRTLLEALCDDGKFEEAAEILGKILRKGLKAPKRNWTRIDLNQSGGSCDNESLKRTISGALVKGGIPSSAGYGAMAIDLYNENNVSEGDRVLKEMRDRGFRTFISIYEAKMTALCRKGEPKEAVSVVETEMIEANCVPNVKLYNIMLKGLCEGGESRSAIGYLKKMAKRTGCVANEETYNILLRGLCNEGEYVEASVVLEKMLSKCYWACDETYNVLVEGLCSVGKPYEAVVWLEEMVSQEKLPERSVWNALVSSVCCDEIADSELERVWFCDYSDDEEFSENLTEIADHCFESHG